MRNECNIIRDFLPLYVEGLVSEDTVDFVEEHLAGCDNCRIELENIKAGVDFEEAPAHIGELKSVKRRLMVSRLLTILVSAVCTAVLLMSMGFPQLTIDGFSNSLAFWGLCGAAVFFIIQLFLCFKAKSRHIRLLPVYLIGVFFGLCLLIGLGAFGDWSGGFLGNMHLLFAVVLAIIGAIACLGVTFAWLIYWTVGRK